MILEDNYPIDQKDRIVNNLKDNSSLLLKYSSGREIEFVDSDGLWKSVDSVLLFSYYPKCRFRLKEVDEKVTNFRR